ncbi:MAG: electron transport complex subunit RsxE [Deltaproteobacteria bacterium RIFCSPLOWO2_12_FULL_44_12]|nr:MAG: electron transport complex subunit RsxE [Deltaproteobacteria bacterium RIFCSPHIGHO2_01_FULL_43_49]OGQ15234.1 MAG: electron transport complex subunit RsxE [Deltaproteobacteria bacterium RIFCSPHIGHO2_02_FULL_44_53]OGQ27143.1 MAG: electron transport complex subunit RsxE [Deltaproteobacteria bacterium RIFCSPHIGHO2_12_FULL_44_21]OGQ31750.1 MAG: electron transport complex subunit RsxE [Deltaproteobacteria bacterium RIFCSPLOWO2_01_FULL_45_74]OGQ42951.1 MAG: electron transport complex subunit R
MSFDKLQAPPFRELLWRGFFSENPVFRLALSLCPAVAVTNSVKNGLMMGLAVWAVQVLSSLTIAIFRNFIHDKVRIPIYTIVIAVWVTAMDMTLAALAPKIYSEIGLYIKLIVAFAIIISRLELFASKFPLIPSVLDGFSMGLGFLFAMVLIGAIREVLGNGTIWGVTLIEVRPILFLVLPAGGFFTIGLLMAALNWVEKGRHV